MIVRPAVGEAIAFEQYAMSLTARHQGVMDVKKASGVRMDIMWPVLGMVERSLQDLL